MADYPNSIYAPRSKENKQGVVYDPAKTTIPFAEDVVKLDDEVVAIETKVGRGASTPVAGKVLTGTGVGESGWADPAGGGGGWELLADITSTVVGNSFDSGTIPARKRLKIYVFSVGQNGEWNIFLRFNDDSGQNYSGKREVNGAASEGLVNETGLRVGGGGYTNSAKVIIADVFADQFLQKFSIAHYYGVRTAAIAGYNATHWGIWHNTADKIVKVTVKCEAEGTFNIGARLVVYGMD